MTHYIIILSFFLAPLHSVCQVQGKIRMQRYLFDSDPQHKSIKITTTVWYLGSQSIQEVPTIVMKEDSLESTVKTEVKYYLYIDSVSTKHLYFGSFFDTARVVARSGKGDLFSKYGGWNLYSKTEFEYDKIQARGDTIIDGKRLTRYDLFKARDKDSFTFVVYGSRSDVKEPIRYLPTISNRIGCPVIRMDTYYNGHLTGRMEIEYVSHELSVHETRVFRSWSKKTQ